MLKPPLGVVTQMRWEQEAARENNLDWSTRLFCPVAGLPPLDILVPATAIPAQKGTGVARRALNWITLRRQYYQWLSTQAPLYDVMLLRYSSCDPFQAVFARGLSTPWYSVNHTLELRELRNAHNALSGSIRATLEQWLGKITLRRASGIIGVTHEIMHYEKERLRAPDKTGYVYPNGIHYPAALQEQEDLRHGVPEIMFIASQFAPWHGLDLLLDSLQSCDAPFILHLVGTLGPKDLSRARNDSRIVVHGLLNGAAIAELSKKCWVGLSSFALHRNHMNEACTLKVREYLLNGLPVYASYQDVFPASFPFYRNGPPHINNILDYAHSVKESTRTDVATQARPFISKSMLVLGLYNWLAPLHSPFVADEV